MQTDRLRCRLLLCLVLLSSSHLEALEPVAELWAEGTSTQDGFARHLAIDGSTLFVSAPSRDEPGENAGAVYVYTSSDASSGWTLEQELRAHDTATGDGFGSALNVEGGRLAVGAFLADLRRAESDRLPIVEAGTAEWSREADVDGCGMVYLFRRGTAGWEEEARLHSPEPKAGDLFGSAVAVSGNTVVVGASGASTAFVFIRDVAGWTLQARLEPAVEMKRRRLGFGCAVAISGDVVVVGDPDADGSHGAVEIFRREAGQWRREQRLQHPSPQQVDGMGYAVAIDGPRLLLGAPTVDDITSQPGRVLAFEYRGGAWHSAGAFQAGPDSRMDGFGRQLQLRGDRAVIGSRGAAYLFEQRSGIWVRALKFELEGETDRTGFGQSVSFDATHVAVGAGYRQRGDRTAGSAFIFPLDTSP